MPQLQLIPWVTGSYQCLYIVIISELTKKNTKLRLLAGYVAFPLKCDLRNTRSTYSPATFEVGQIVGLQYDCLFQ